jgi:hypothetical protein
MLPPTGLLPTEEPGLPPFPEEPDKLGLSKLDPEGELPVTGLLFPEEIDEDEMTSPGLSFP